MDVLTSKTKISEILDENHIILLPNEKVIPGSEEEISDNKTIKITKMLVLLKHKILRLYQKSYQWIKYYQIIIL